MLYSIKIRDRVGDPWRKWTFHQTLTQLLRSLRWLRRQGWIVGPRRVRPGTLKPGAFRRQPERSYVRVEREPCEVKRTPGASIA